MLRDDRLVGLTARGRATGFEAIADRHGPLLLRYCRALLLDAADAADAYHVAMVDARRELERTPPPGRLRPWLMRIVHHEAVTMLRARGREPEVELVVANGAEAAQIQDRLEELVSDLRALPEGERCALLLRDLCELGYEEIATVLTCQEDKARRWVEDGRYRVYGFTPGPGFDCRSIRRAIVEGEVRGPQARPVKSHVGGCPDCAAFQAAVNERRADLPRMVDSLAEPEAGRVRRTRDGIGGHIDPTVRAAEPPAERRAGERAHPQATGDWSWPEPHEAPPAVEDTGAWAWPAPEARTGEAAREFDWSRPAPGEPAEAVEPEAAEAGSSWPAGDEPAEPEARESGWNWSAGDEPAESEARESGWSWPGADEASEARASGWTWSEIEPAEAPESSGAWSESEVHETAEAASPPAAPSDSLPAWPAPLAEESPSVADADRGLDEPGVREVDGEPEASHPASVWPALPVEEAQPEGSADEAEPTAVWPPPEAEPTAVWPAAIEPEPTGTAAGEPDAPEPAADELEPVAEAAQDEPVAQDSEVELEPIAGADLDRLDRESAGQAEELQPLTEATAEEPVGEPVAPEAEELEPIARAGQDEPVDQPVAGLEPAGDPFAADDEVLPTLTPMPEPAAAERAAAPQPTLPEERGWTWDEEAALTPVARQTSPEEPEEAAAAPPPADGEKAWVEAQGAPAPNGDGPHDPSHEAPIAPTGLWGAGTLSGAASRDPEPDPEPTGLWSTSTGPADEHDPTPGHTAGAEYDADALVGATAGGEADADASVVDEYEADALVGAVAGGESDADASVVDEYEADALVGATAGGESDAEASTADEHEDGTTADDAGDDLAGRHLLLVPPGSGGEYEDEPTGGETQDPFDDIEDDWSGFERGPASPPPLYAGGAFGDPEWFSDAHEPAAEADQSAEAEAEEPLPDQAPETEEWAPLPMPPEPAPPARRSRDEHDGRRRAGATAGGGAGLAGRRRRGDGEGGSSRRRGAVVGVVAVALVAAGIGMLAGGGGDDESGQGDNRADTGNVIGGADAPALRDGSPALRRSDQARREAAERALRRARERRASRAAKARAERRERAARRASRERRRRRAAPVPRSAPTVPVSNRSPSAPSRSTAPTPVRSTGPSRTTNRNRGRVVSPSRPSVGGPSNGAAPAPTVSQDDIVRQQQEASRP